MLDVLFCSVLCSATLPSLFLVLLMPIFFVLLYSNVNYILKGIAVYFKMG